MQRVGFPILIEFWAVEGLEMQLFCNESLVDVFKAHSLDKERCIVHVKEYVP